MKRCTGKSNIDIVKDYLAGVRPFVEVSMHISEKDKHRHEGEKWTDPDGIQWQKLKATLSEKPLVTDSIVKSVVPNTNGLVNKTAKCSDEQVCVMTA